MKKTERIAEFVQELGVAGSGGLDPYLAGYLRCFNEGRYYEAHDVLEDLWLRQGKVHHDHAFHKGLIQLAGAFVHLRLQYLYPDHPKHGRRLAPARRLLILAHGNLSGYPVNHLGVDVSKCILLVGETALEIREGGENPWSPTRIPCLGILSSERR
jgi:Domain of unknown function (DUF309)